MGAVARCRASDDTASNPRSAVPPVRSACVRTRRLPLLDADRAAAGRRGRDKMSRIMTDAVALDAPHPMKADRFEDAGALALFGIAGALQFSIAAAQILLTIALVCWAALLLLRRERFEAPAFFSPLLVYAAATLISAGFSSDPRTSAIDCKQLVLFLLVPLTSRLASGTRRG